MKEKSFILKNEHEVNVLSTRILFLACMVIFPLLLILNYIHLFNINWTQLIIIAISGLIFAAIPFILTKVGGNSTLIKYLTIIISTLIIGILATNPKIGIYMIYLFPVALSCLYFDRKLTFTACCIGIPNLAISQYIRFATEYSSNHGSMMSSYTAWMAGFIIEYIALSAIFMALTRRTTALFENLVDSDEQASLLEKLEQVMDKSKEASSILASSVNELSASITQTTENNKLIAANTSKVSEGSSQNLNYIEKTYTTAESISSSLEGISVKTNELVEISSGTYDAANSSMDIILNAIESMKAIETLSDENKTMMNRLGETSKEIGNIVQIISSITEQTNLLSLNASIESARAGEHGKGFAVVAEQIRKLAEQSAASAKDISNLIVNIQNDSNNAIRSIDEGANAIKTGINYVKTAGESFQKVRALQEQSNEKVQNIFMACINASEFGNKIKEMVTNVKDITKELLENLQSIAASTDSQSSAMDEIAASFEEINKIADELLSLSKNI